jgi:uncharacterized membrane protein YedE/YeeE
MVVFVFFVIALFAGLAYAILLLLNKLFPSSKAASFKTDKKVKPTLQFAAVIIVAFIVFSFSFGHGKQITRLLILKKSSSVIK